MKTTKQVLKSGMFEDINVQHLILDLYNIKSILRVAKRNKRGKVNVPKEKELKPTKVVKISRKKDNPLTEKLVEMLEESGAKVVNVKTVEEKRLEKIREIWSKIQKEEFGLFTHRELRKAMFEGDIPICLKCGKLMKNARDTITGEISKYLWECECSPNLRLSVG